MTDAGVDWVELIDTLTLRFDLLSALAEAERERPQLVDALQQSEATIYRGIKDLKQFGLAEYGAGGYRPTNVGRLLLGEYESFISLLEGTAAAQEILNRVPADPLPSPDFLRECDVVTGGRPTPHAPGTRMRKLLSDAVRVKGLGRVHSQSDAPDVFYDNVVEGGLEAEFVIEAESLARMRQSANPKLDTLHRHDRYTVYERDGIPYGLFILDFEPDRQLAVLLGYDAENFLRGLLINDTPPAIDWAETTYREYKQQAQLVEF